MRQRSVSLTSAVRYGSFVFVVEFELPPFGELNEVSISSQVGERDCPITASSSAWALACTEGKAQSARMQDIIVLLVVSTPPPIRFAVKPATSTSERPCSCCDLTRVLAKLGRDFDVDADAEPREDFSSSALALSRERR